MTRWRGLFKIGVSMKQLPRFFKCFIHHWSGWSRSEDTQLAAKSYLMGVVLPGRKKNMTGISQKVGLDSNIVQQFITDSPWDPQEIMKTNIRTMLSNRIASENGVIIVDDTGQKKKGKKSPGTKRQYSGTLGKVDNCQVAVASCYTTPGSIRNADAIYWPGGMKLYIPEDWFEDRERCREAGIPDDVEFQTKPEIGLELIKSLLEEKVPHCAITTDTGYGTNGNFRRGLQELEEPYAVAVTPSDISIVPEDTPLMFEGKQNADDIALFSMEDLRFPRGVKSKTADVVAMEIPDDAWQEVEWSEGTKGKLSALFTRIQVRVAKDNRPTDETGWMLFERTIDDELKVYMCWELDNVSLEGLVRIVHIRWPVEQCFKQMKGELGLDKFEGRKYPGWHHHAAMILMAFCYLMLQRVIGSPTGEKLPSLPQVRREILRIFVKRLFERRLKVSSKEAEDILRDIPFLVPE